MMLAEKIAARTLELAGAAAPRQQKLIQSLSAAAAAELEAALRKKEDLQAREEILVTAGSLSTLADFLETEGAASADRFTVGDVTVENRDVGQSAGELRRLSLRMTAHLRKSGFRFQGV